MAHSGNISHHDHTIDIPRNDVTSPSTSHQDNHNDLDELHDNRGTSSEVPPVLENSSGTTAASNSRNASSARRDQGHRQQNLLNSGFWISIELIVNVSQIIAAISVLSVSRNEHPHAPLFEWLIGYTVGCIATLPHLYWRYLHRNCQNTEQESTSQASSERNISEPNSYAVISSAQASDVVDGPNSTGVSRSNLPIASPRLCIVFLAFGFIGYALPFILCSMICCCLPCIISMMSFHEDLDLNRGATTEAINALVAYKFKSKRIHDGDVGEDSGGVLAAGTDKERAISAEDAVCCICLSKYSNNEDLRELPCVHVFHMECVDKWLKINAMCPLCKAELGGSTNAPDTSSGGIITTTEETTSSHNSSCSSVFSHEHEDGTRPFLWSKLINL